MTDFLQLKPDQIVVTDDRSREVDEDYALAIQASIVEMGQLQPIIVRRTPNGKAPFTLVDGAHRVWAVTQLDDGEPLEAMVVKADSVDAAMMEVTANIFRNDLTALNRAVAVKMYRDAWEQKHGAVSRGGDQSAKFALSSAGVVEGEAEAGFGQTCADRMGLSKRSVAYAIKIATNLNAAQIAALRKSTAADNQSQLLAFAGLPDKQRHKICHALNVADGDATQALENILAKPKDKRTHQDKAYDACTTAFSKLTAARRAKTIADLQTLHDQLTENASKKGKA